MEQFDTGLKTYKAKLKLPIDEHIFGAGKENRAAASKNGRKATFRTAALDITQREYMANSAICRQVVEFHREGMYCYALGEKPENYSCLMFENWNSLEVFTG